MSLSTLNQLAKKLGCFGIAQTLEGRLAEAAAEQFSYEDFVSRIFHDELAIRTQRTTLRMISRARFRSHCDLENWDNSYDRGISRAKLKDLSLLAFADNRENLIIFGSTGSGKTHLATALGRRLCAKEKSVRFFSVNALFEEVAACKASAKSLSFIRGLAKIFTLILDDFGLRNYTHDEAIVLLDILEERYQRGQLIITSQVKPEGWRALFQDPVVADAIIDRIQHPSQTIHLKGVSYRTKMTPAKNNLNEGGHKE